MKKNLYKISIVGLGYVGLPLAVELGKHFHTIGFDISEKRIKELNNLEDYNHECSKKEIKSSKNLIFSNNHQDLLDTDIFIVCVPTPIYGNKKINLNPLISATKLISNVMKKKSSIIYESTVYPGLTQEVLLPILISNKKKLEFKRDFSIGYSPERINPGDKKHNIKNITKIISASDKVLLNKMEFIYGKFTKTHKVKSIKIAEAAKVIENTQRDINIAFINEITKLFSRDNINIVEVLSAAKTKWNFVDFKPGLVGGHCIGVDPYYLSHYAKKLKQNLKITLAGRNINNSMSSYIVQRYINNFKPKKILKS